MVLIQVGTATQHAGIIHIMYLCTQYITTSCIGFTFAGCLTGALLYSVIYHCVPPKRNNENKLFV